MERAYQDYIRKIEIEPETELGCIAIDTKTEVDFKSKLMHKPHKRKIRRSFLNGFWVQIKTSPSQMQLHAKINRLQIDNQMFDCVFPVVLAPITPSRSITANSIKPFVEVSIVQLLLKNSQIRQFKYFKVLVQEFHVKVDMGFINAIMELLEQSENSDEDEKKLFLADMKLLKEELYSHAYSQSIQEQKSFYDLLHFSPFKIHISFSMAIGASSNQSPSTPDFINVLLQGLGVTLTDMQDVVFKLAYFERSYTFLTKRQLISEATRHYVGQAVKQLYVLVLGLDVLGNPYGLVIGITKGVEDFFYEPIQVNSN
ncbi:intermembrane lipid transfer protein Vps13-like isoform X2 [Leptinotarsa decemlineata]|uniref:intermembrane lipid transfer protein Vps13-like isoform X2 n=1 Tax=Leptinotarsa decemlineata TaxID=7539 RepID=UPI003D305DB1